MARMRSLASSSDDVSGAPTLIVPSSSISMVAPVSSSTAAAVAANVAVLCVGGRSGLTLSATVGEARDGLVDEREHQAIGQACDPVAHFDAWQSSENSQAAATGRPEVRYCSLSAPPDYFKLSLLYFGFQFVASIRTDRCSSCELPTSCRTGPDSTGILS